MPFLDMINHTALPAQIGAKTRTNGAQLENDIVEIAMLALIMRLPSQWEHLI